MKPAAEAVVIAVVVAIAAGGGYLIYGFSVSRASQGTNTNSTFLTSTTSTSSTSILATSTTSTCSGYPPGGDCYGPYNYTFALSVNYTGPWKLSYQGYNSTGENTSGRYQGAGFFSTQITVTGLDSGWLRLCAQAQKLDGSNSTMVLRITGSNQTSLPYGSVSYCGGVVP